MFACGFSNKWCNIIKMSISTIKISALLDGAPHRSCFQYCPILSWFATKSQRKWCLQSILSNLNFGGERKATTSAGLSHGKKICQPKWNGGAGIRSLFNMSIALLAKSAWRILTDTDSLLSHVFRAKFGNKFNWVDCTANGSSPSLNSAIKTGLEQLKNKLVWKIGDGSHIRSLGAWFARSYPKS